MVIMVTLSEKDLLYAMEKGEFSRDILQKQENVVILFTQDWCPQWKRMEKYLKEAKADKDILIYVCIYNQNNMFDRIRNFKESIWGNDLIPYLRFYHHGNFVKESNYLAESAFFDSFEQNR